jgi:DNA topoisomerase-1
MRLRTVSPNDPGWSRRRAGKGFIYLDELGERLNATDVERIKALVIPPAWKDVWICSVENGHIQCVGTDVAGRRQYIYHQEWRRKRDEAKFDRVLQMAKRLPNARKRFVADLADDELSFSRVLAGAVRLIDVGYFRIGSAVYADEHGSYGLTTLERRHVHKKGDAFVFVFEGKSGVEHEIEVDDPDLFDLIDRLRRRRGGEDKLLTYKDGRRWRAVDASDVNEYLRSVFDAEVTAKDFRTWHATVIAATALADEKVPATTKTARRKAVRQAVLEVAEYLGNTPTIARGSYIDPRVIDLYEDGVTIAAALQKASKSPNKRQEQLERAVLRLLSRSPSAARPRPTR